LLLGTAAGLLAPVVRPRITTRQDPEPPPNATSSTAPTIPATVTPASKPRPDGPISLEDEVNRAIERGVAYLRWRAQDMPKESDDAALVGLALLECGVGVDDPDIKRIADELRGQQTEDRQNYEVSLHILFLDRLGQERDEAVIRQRANLLLRRQFANGTWSYREVVFAQAPANAKPLSIRAQWDAVVPAVQALEPSGDHSNTQFAALALWVAARHGVAVRDSLARTDVHFRKVQNSDGGWGYTPGRPSSESMTCGALMSLAMGHAVGSGVETPAIPMFQGAPRSVPVGALPDRQAVMAQGLAALGRALESRASANALPGMMIPRDIGVTYWGELYFLWSLERMAMIYQLDTIGKLPWYPWAARLLVDCQFPDGHWHGAHSGPVNTSFALLVLKRSNRAGDLTAMIRKAAEQNELPFLPGLVERKTEPKHLLIPPPEPASHSAPQAGTPEIRSQLGHNDPRSR
jgi:hypothetical protein